MSLEYASFLAFIRFARVFKITYVRRHLRTWLRGVGTLYQVLRLLYTFVGISLCVCCVVQIAERYAGGNVWTFDQALYFTFTTLSTTGYGDLSAVSLLGRGVVVCIMLTSLVFIPLNTAMMCVGVRAESNQREC